MAMILFHADPLSWAILLHIYIIPDPLGVNIQFLCFNITYIREDEKN